MRVWSGAEDIVLPKRKVPTHSLHVSGPLLPNIFTEIILVQPGNLGASHFEGPPSMDPLAGRVFASGGVCQLVYSLNTGQAGLSFSCPKRQTYLHLGE